MDMNIEMLNFIYQNAEMGQSTINQLLKISKDEKFGALLQSQLNEYRKIFNRAEQLIKQSGKEAKDISTRQKITVYIMINLETIKDKTPSHISEMMIQGSTMGIIDITKKIKEYAQADRDIMELAKQLLAFEQRNVEELKKFL